MTCLALACSLPQEIFSRLPEITAETFMPGTQVLIYDRLFAGSHKIEKCNDPFMFMHPQCILLDGVGVSWWVVATGDWCLQIWGVLDSSR